MKKFEEPICDLEIAVALWMLVEMAAMIVCVIVVIISMISCGPIHLEGSISLGDQTIEKQEKLKQKTSSSSNSWISAAEGAIGIATPVPTPPPIAPPVPTLPPAAMVLPMESESVPGTR